MAHVSTETKMLPNCNCNDADSSIVQNQPPHRLVGQSNPQLPKKTKVSLASTAH